MTMTNESKHLYYTPILIALAHKKCCYAEFYSAYVVYWVGLQ